MRRAALLLTISLLLAGCAEVPTRANSPVVAPVLQVTSEPDPQCVEAIRLARLTFSANADILDALSRVLKLIPPALEGAMRMDADPVRDLSEELRDANAVIEDANDRIDAPAFNTAAEGCLAGS